jgi:accessory gene regulator protein AgrB
MKVIDIIKSIAHDTLKKDVNGVREWDRMKLTMFVSFIVAIIFAIVDFIHQGLRLDVWLTLIGFAYGSKLIDAQAKKIEK